jgi:hypothetical protein
MYTTKPESKMPFEAIDVYVTPAGTNLIEWTVNRCWPIPDCGGVIEFYVEVARSAGEWYRLNPDTPIVNECVHVDPSTYKCNLNNDWYYRVIMAVCGEEYTSPPQQAMGVWNSHDYKIARDIVRKEYLHLQKFVGTRGFLLKRRYTGVKCTECDDWDTGQPTSPLCGNCFGTGYENGYYNAVPFWFDLSRTGEMTDSNGVTGTNDAARIRNGARAVAYPRIGTYDIWVDADKNKRYVIWHIDNAMEIRGKPLVYSVQLKELSGNRVEYKIPLKQDPPENDPTPKQGGWETDITKKYDINSVYDY